MTATYPNWVHEVSETRLADVFGAPTLAKGRDYAKQGRVGHIAVGFSNSDSVLQAQVRGSGYHSYQTVVRHDADGRIESSCSCPVRWNCKHGAAVVWHMRTVNQRSLTPPWQKALADIAGEAHATNHGQPLAIQVSSSAAGVLLRPLVWGRSQRWVRSGITWDTVTRTWGTEYREDHRAALEGLSRSRGESRGYYFYGHRADVLSLTELGAGCWNWLQRAVDAGVELIGDRDTPAPQLSATRARLTSRISTVAAGLQLHTVAASGEGEWTVPPAHLVGDPVHGFVVTEQDRLLLTPFDAPLSAGQRALLQQHRRLEIPTADVPAFAAEFYPALRRRVAVQLDPDVDLPATQPPRLLLQVRFAPEHVTELTWSVRYRVGQADFYLDLEPIGQQPAYRDRDAELALLQALPDGAWPRPDARPGPLVAHSRLTGAATAEFATTGLDDLAAAGVIVQVSGERPQYRLATQAPQVNVAITDPEESTDWFNLAVTVSVDDEPIEFRDLFTALATGQSHLILPSGTWFSLDRPELDQLRSLIEEAGQLQPSDGEPGLRLRAEHAGLWDELVSLGVVAEQSAAWTAAAGALLNTAELPRLPIPTDLRATLRSYQELGFRWLHFLFTARLGGILADDMGLGKTLQALALVSAVAQDGQLGRPALVVAPTSVLGTWAAEAARFAPGLRVRVVAQTAKKRNQSLAALAEDADLLVTSYTLLRLDAEEYAALSWTMVFLDEAQFVKNRNSLAYAAVRRLRAQSKFAVTGTPLENNLMDLWSLLSITAPGLFANPEVFSRLYRRPIESGADPSALPRLHRRVRPLMLRRTKDTVVSELPPKQEQVLTVPLTPAHRRLYDRQLAAERKKVLGLVSDLQHNRIKILASLTTLRQLALSPALVIPEHDPVSAKIDTLVDLVGELAAEGHRALVFSQFTRYLKLVRERLTAENIATSYLDGRTRDRAARIEGFRTGTDPVFLISLKAGGFGLTLTEADYVFILDPWWNPAAETQAIDRTHRIGQDKPVMVYRLVSEDTIEEKVVALQERKRDLFAKVVGEAGDLAAPLTAADIRGLLEA